VNLELPIIAKLFLNFILYMTLESFLNIIQTEP